MSKSICVAEDNKDLQEIFMMILEMTPHRINMVTDGREAMDFLTTNKPDLVILDVNMPHVSGLDVLRHIRESGNFIHTKVMIVTGNVHINVEAEAAYADVILIKPFDMSELKTLVDRLLSPVA